MITQTMRSGLDNRTNVRYNQMVVFGRESAFWGMQVSNCAWKLNSRWGMAYVEDRKLANEMLGLGGRIAATYHRKSGKPFAWQVQFGLGRWEDVVGMLGLTPVEKKRRL
ncbi:MAG: hypothetical protein ACYC2Y_03765 [Armatimonadota bacterium]